MANSGNQAGSGPGSQTPVLKACKCHLDRDTPSLKVKNTGISRVTITAAEIRIPGTTREGQDVTVVWTMREASVVIEPSDECRLGFTLSAHDPLKLSYRGKPLFEYWFNNTTGEHQESLELDRDWPEGW